MKRRDLTGERFGRLVVIGPDSDYIQPNGKHRPRWICECDCGKQKSINGEALTRGLTNSCGCLQKEQTSKAVKTHGQTNTRLYGIWCAIKRRCYHEYDPNYRLYGGRGITMCDEWLNSYETFMDWAMGNGYDPLAKRGECTIDRIDNNGNYSPDNCRWVSQQEQMNNVSYNRRITYNGESHTVAEWARLYNIPYSRLLNRLDKYNYTIEKALTK